MNLFGIDQHIWAGLIVALGGLIIGIYLYLRYRPHDIRLAQAILLAGIGWAVVSFFRVSRLTEAMDEGTKAILGLFGVLLGAAIFVLLLRAVLRSSIPGNHTPSERKR
jgi:hypothetical protein